MEVVIRMEKCQRKQVEMTRTTRRIGPLHHWAGSVFLVLGAYQIALGIYFAVLRPALLPEDARFIGRPLPPNLEAWLDLVFTVMGGQMAALGVVILAFAARFFDPALRSRFDLIALVLAGLASAGVMSLANFALESEFKWILLAPLMLWGVAAALSVIADQPLAGGSR